VFGRGGEASCRQSTIRAHRASVVRCRMARDAVGNSKEAGGHILGHGVRRPRTASPRGLRAHPPNQLDASSHDRTWSAEAWAVSGSSPVACVRAHARACAPWSQRASLRLREIRCLRRAEPGPSRSEARREQDRKQHHLATSPRAPPRCDEQVPRQQCICRAAELLPGPSIVTDHFRSSDAISPSSSAGAWRGRSYCPAL